MKALPARPSFSSCRGAARGYPQARRLAAASLGVLAGVLLAAGPALSQRIAPDRSGYATGEVLIDSGVLDNLGRDPYGRAAPQSPAAQQRKPQLKPPATPAQAAPDWTPAPYATVPPGGLLPPPGPGELERRQAEINAALGRAQAAPPQAAIPAAAPAKPAAAPAKSAAPAKPAAAPAKQAAKPQPKPVKSVAAPAAAAPSRQLPQFQTPAYQPPAAMAATPSVPPLPAAPTPEPSPMAPPVATPQGFTAPPRPAVSPVPAPASAPPPASMPMAAAPAAPTPIAPAKPPSAQPAQPQSPVRVAAPAPGPTSVPPLPPQAQSAARPPLAEPAPPFVPSGKSAARVSFLTGSSDLPENAKPQLKAVADQMNRDGDMRVQLLAYAGPREDTASQTRRLSLFRALAVRTYLIEQGIRSTRMDVRAMGNKFDEEPADRVDVVIAER